jgi:hypothetical protein
MNDGKSIPPRHHWAGRIQGVLYINTRFAMGRPMAYAVFHIAVGLRHSHSSALVGIAKLGSKR